MGKRFAIVVGVAAAGVVALGAGACGGDDDDETTASAEKVTVTTSDTAKGYTWDVSPTPTAETTSVTLKNESKEEHGLIFARLGKGYTVDEAFELQGEKGSATEVIRATGAGPGKSATADVTEPLKAGDYVLICPIVGKDGPPTTSSGSSTSSRSSKRKPSKPPGCRSRRCRRRTWRR